MRSMRGFRRAGSGEETLLIDFETGYEIDRTVHAIAESHTSGSWIDLN